MRRLSGGNQESSAHSKKLEDHTVGTGEKETDQDDNNQNPVSHQLLRRRQ